MRITLIKPHLVSGYQRKYIPSDLMQPLTIAVLAGLTPAQHEIVFYDDRLEPISFDEPTDLVAITVETYTAKRSYEIAAEFRRRSIPVVMGGFHPTLIPEEAIEYADSVVIGEAEGIWEQVLTDAQSKQLKRFYQSRQRPSLCNIKPRRDIFKSRQRPSLCNIKPRRDIFKGKKYLPLNLVEFSRGCRYNCDFCAVSAFYRQTNNCRPVEEVIREVESLDDKIVFFVDDNIVANRSAAKELFRRLIPLKKKWIGQCSIQIAEDEGLLKLVARSGCRGMLIGIESLIKENLSRMNKLWNYQGKDYHALLKKIRDFGIKVYATFVLGYDGDSKDSFKKNLEFAIKQKFFLAAFNHLVPFPGTPLYQNLSR
ncbi:MAG: radical SAM protein [Candidatus Omnitrophota bacterium]